MIKHFTAVDPVSRWTCAKACRRATARNAASFLDKLQAEMPFPVTAIQVDGGSEFMEKFEQECQRRGIELWVLPPRSPQLYGSVERMQASWRYEFYACWQYNDKLTDLSNWIDAFADEFNTFRPHQALAGLTPKQHLDRLAKAETQTESKQAQDSHMYWARTGT